MTDHNNSNTIHCRPTTINETIHCLRVYVYVLLLFSGVFYYYYYFFFISFARALSFPSVGKKYIFIPIYAMCIRPTTSSVLAAVFGQRHCLQHVLFSFVRRHCSPARAVMWKNAFLWTFFAARPNTCSPHTLFPVSSYTCILYIPTRIYIIYIKV